MLDALTRLREIAESSSGHAWPTMGQPASNRPLNTVRRTWVTEAEAVELSGRSRWTVRDWRLAGLLTPRSIYGVRMYRRDDVIAVRDAQAENYRRGVTRPRRPHSRVCAGQLTLSI